jgi:hypothetical protein
VQRATEFGSPRHLVTRFFGALWPGGPPGADEAWARRFLLPAERDLWEQMSGPDRRHAVGVARGALELLGAGGARHDDTLAPGGDEAGDAARAVVASALLHDVGKIESGLGTVGRALVTMLALAVGRSRLAAAPAGTAPEGRWRRRARLYLSHDRLGAALLERAGSDRLTVAWAAEHHADPARWTVDPRIGAALKAADDD